MQAQYMNVSLYGNAGCAETVVQRCWVRVRASPRIEVTDPRLALHCVGDNSWIVVRFESDAFCSHRCFFSWFQRVPPWFGERSVGELGGLGADTQSLQLPHSRW